MHMPVAVSCMAEPEVEPMPVLMTISIGNVQQLVGCLLASMALSAT
jgi:hypothetical protein